MKKFMMWLAGIAAAVLCCVPFWGQRSADAVTAKAESVAPNVGVPAQQLPLDVVTYSGGTYNVVCLPSVYFSANSLDVPPGSAYILRESVLTICFAYSFDSNNNVVYNGLPFVRVQYKVGGSGSPSTYVTRLQYDGEKPQTRNMASLSMAYAGVANEVLVYYIIPSDINSISNYLCTFHYQQNSINKVTFSWDFGAGGAILADFTTVNQISNTNANPFWWFRNGYFSFYSKNVSADIGYFSFGNTASQISSGYSDQAYLNYGQLQFDKGLEAGRQEGNASGYAKGYQAGIETAEKGDFVSLISAAVGAPVGVVKDFLNFELLGINILAFVSSLLTVFLIVKVLKLFAGGK